MRCSNVQISAAGVSQLEGNAVIATVPKEEILTVKLCHDSQSRRPFLRFSSGFILITIGLVFLTTAFLMAEGGVFLVQMKSITLGVPVIPIVLWGMVGCGLWLILGVFRGRYNLMITTSSGSRKIFFAPSADIREIRSFAARAVRELGYEIDLSLLDTMILDSDISKCRCM